MEYIKFLDVYGVSFDFRINNSEKLKTSIGGLFTIFTIIVSLFISFILGRDFYYRQNPVINSQMKFEVNFPFWELKNNNNITIAFRLEDDNGKKLEIDKIFPKVYYNYWKNIKDTNFELEYIYKIQPKLCNSFDFLPKKTIATEDWYCLDFSGLDDKLLIGNYNFKENIGELMIQLDSCSYDENIEKIKKGDISKKENSTCGDVNSYKEIFNNYTNKIFINVMVPKIYIQHDSINETINYSNFFYFKKLDYLMNSEDYIYFNKITFHDDKGWIFPSNESIQLLSFQESRQNFKSISKEEYENSKNVKLFALNLLMSRQEEISRRKFMKIQDVFAISGGFISFFKMLFSSINFYFCQNEINKILLNYYFNNFYKNDKSEIQKYEIDPRINDFRNHLKKEKEVDLVRNSVYFKEMKIPNSRIIEGNVFKLNEIKSRVNRLRMMNSVKQKTILMNTNNNFSNFSLITENMDKNNNINVENNLIYNLNNQIREVEMGRKDERRKTNKNDEFKRNLIKNEKDNWNNSSNRFLKDSNNIDFKVQKNELSNKLSKIESVNDKNQLFETLCIFKKLKNLSNFSEVSIYKNLFRKCFKDKKVLKIYEKSMQKMHKKIDVLNFLKILKYIKVMKQLLLKEEQTHFLKNYYGENFCMKKEKCPIEENKRLLIKNHKLINYFDFILKNTNNCDIIDKLILSNFSQNMTDNYINNK